MCVCSVCVLSGFQQLVDLTSKNRVSTRWLKHAANTFLLQRVINLALKVINKLLPEASVSFDVQQRHIIIMKHSM